MRFPAYFGANCSKYRREIFPEPTNVKVKVRATHHHRRGQAGPLDGTSKDGDTTLSHLKHKSLKRNN